MRKVTSFLYIHSFVIVLNKCHIDNATKESLLSWLTSPAGQSMEVDSADKPNTLELVVVPEAEMYLRLLILYHLLTSEDTHEKALELANETVEKMQALNRRSMDALAAKVWFAVDRAYELAGELSDARP
jgi:26S proteasome regulatory subunit N3